MSEERQLITEAMRSCIGRESERLCLCRHAEVLREAEKEDQP